MAANTPPTVVYDFWAVSAFFRTAALWIAYVRHVDTDWEAFDDARINAMYSVLAWKGRPGFADWTSGDDASILAMRDRLHEKYLDKWLTILAKDGPLAALLYYQKKEADREQALRLWSEKIKGNLEFNAEGRSTAREAIGRLKMIRLLSTVGISVLSAGSLGVMVVRLIQGGGLGAAAAVGAGATASTATGLTAWLAAVAPTGIDIAYSSGLTLVDDWHKSAGAKVAAVSIHVESEAREEAAEQLVEHAAKKRVAGAAAKVARGEQITRKLARKAQSLGKQLEHTILTKAQGRAILKRATKTARKRLASSVAEHALTVAAEQSARALARKVPIVFLANDVREALIDYLSDEPGLAD